MADLKMLIGGALVAGDETMEVVRLIEGAFRSADLGLRIEGPAQAATGADLPIRVVLDNDGPDAAASAFVGLGMAGAPRLGSIMRS